MYIVGLTGGIGSGKTAASDLFAAKGIAIIDADIVSREVVEPGSPALSKIEEHFGANILLKNGTLNRAKLREIIFQSELEKKWLERLLHPIIRDETIRQLENAASSYTILSSPLLLETDQHNLTHRILLIDVPEDIQVERASRRDSNSEQQIRSIIQSQANRDFKRNKADDIIDNSGDLESLNEQVEHYHQFYLAQVSKQ